MSSAINWARVSIATPPVEHIETKNEETTRFLHVDGGNKVDFRWLRIPSIFSMDSFESGTEWRKNSLFHLWQIAVPFENIDRTLAWSSFKSSSEARK